MFTIDFDYDDIEIVIVDDAGFYEDLSINSFDDIVYIRQWDNELERYNTIIISPQMWEEMISAINSPEGAFTKRPVDK